MPRARWVIVAPFFNGSDSVWLDDFIADTCLDITKVAPSRKQRSWHTRKAQLTTRSEWLTHLSHARDAFRRRPDGIVTCFPQLAMCAAMLRKFSVRKPRIIAYNYNLGELRPGPRQRLARWVAAEVETYVVHAPDEVESYARYLGVPPGRVRFVPLQMGRIGIARDEDREAPYVIAIGSAKRDYPTLIAAVDRLGVRTIIVTRSADADALPKSAHVTVLSGLSERECQDLVARARISVTPIANRQTASGQVTVLQAMQLGVPVIATDCLGVDGYVEDGRSGLTVKPGDIDDLARAIEGLWNDDARREALGRAASEEARTRFSDEAAAETLRRLMRGDDA